MEDKIINYIEKHEKEKLSITEVFSYMKDTFGIDLKLLDMNFHTTKYTDENKEQIKEHLNIFVYIHMI